jgi:hypothetical protein
MDTRLAAGSGVGLVVDTLIGLIVDAMFAHDGMAMVIGGATGISLGAGVAVATCEGSEDGE